MLESADAAPMIHVRDATIDDAAALARLHVAAWAETYGGRLPQRVIAARGLPTRTELWRRALAAGTTRIALADGAGFAQVGPQRDAVLAAQGFETELWAIYVLRAAQGVGLGRRLLRHALGPTPRPFTALVLDLNAAAIAFYARTGAVEIGRRAEWVDDVAVTDVVMAWPDPGDLAAAP